MSRDRFLGVVEALLVTFLWSSSYILVKIGLDQIQIPPLTLVALRYAVASAVLIPLALRRGGSSMLGDPKFLTRIALLGRTGAGGGGWVVATK